MRSHITAYISLLIILVFIFYIIYDTSKPDVSEKINSAESEKPYVEENWEITDSIVPAFENLSSVAVSLKGDIFLAGESFVACYNDTLNLIWNISFFNPVTALATSGDTIFAATQETVLLIDKNGRTIDEYGPYNDGSIITSVSANKEYIALADAGNKVVYILKKSGELVTVIGQNGKRLIIPSPYFDIILTSNNNLMLANTGEHNVETRTFENKVINVIGKAGLSPGSFCGCCNPAHIAELPEGLVTAEKGINRIKIIRNDGEFVEFVSAVNNFTASVPLDLATYNGKIIYAANPEDSRLYIFKRKQ